MTLASTQSEFRSDIKKYLDHVNDDNETVYVTRSNNRVVAIISQEKMRWIEKALNANENSLDYAIARDKLIEMGLIADDPVVDPQKFWEQFK